MLGHRPGFSLSLLNEMLFDCELVWRWYTYLSWAWLSCKLLAIEECYKTTRKFHLTPWRGTAAWFSGLPLTPLCPGKRKFHNIDVAPALMRGQLRLCKSEIAVGSGLLNLALQGRRFWQVWTSPPVELPRGNNSLASSEDRLFVDEAFELRSTSGETGACETRTLAQHKHTRHMLPHFWGPLVS